jgi:hypothetical protein
MALTKETMNDKIEVLQLAAGYPVVQVRTATIIAEDGAEISRTFHRHVLTPDADLSAEVLMCSRSLPRCLRTRPRRLTLLRRLPSKDACDGPTDHC